MNRSGTRLRIGVVMMLVFTCCRNQDESLKNSNKPDSLYSGARFSEHVRSTPARTPEEERVGFRLPEGFEITLFASEPDIGKPMNMAFDAQGRLWVTQSYEYPFAATPGKGRDRISILEDTDHDGKADKFTVFSDTLNIPIGILPYSAGAFSFSIPNLSFYEDKDSDGKADQEKKLVGPFQHRDTHGMVNNFIRGYDGWVHACHGYTNRSTVAGSDGDSIRMTSGNTFRFSVDGRKVEHMTHGRINPFGLAWDERGYLYSTDCHTSPLYQLIKGGDYYQWGKEEEMGFAPDMKPMEDEATALCGIAYYTDNLFPDNYRRNFYIGDAVSCRVYRNSFSFNGSSPVGKKEENFVLSEDPWFRPVDIKPGPDGALYIADFYNSIIGHYEVPLDHPKRDKVRGRIWRITYKGKSNPVQNLTKANVQELMRWLDAENLSVRMQAADQLTDRIGKPAATFIQQQLLVKEITARQKILMLWVLHRLNSISPETLKKYAADPNPLIRLHTLRIVAERKNETREFRQLGFAALEDKDPHVCRVGTEIVQYFPDIESVEKLISFRRGVPETDNHMIYSTRLSLRNMLRNPGLMHVVAERKWLPEQAAVLATVLVGVQTPESGQLMLRYLREQTIAANELPKVITHVSRFCNRNQLPEIVDLARIKSGDSVYSIWAGYAALEKGISQGGSKEPSNMDDWGRQVSYQLLQVPMPPMTEQSKYEQWEDMQRFAFTLAGKYRLSELKNQVLKVATDSMRSPYLRIPAVRALLKIDYTDGINRTRKMLEAPGENSEWRRSLVNLLIEFPGPSTVELLSSIKSPAPDLQQPLIMALAQNKGGKEIVFEKVKRGEIYTRYLAQAQVKERMLLNSSPAQQKTYNELVADLSEIKREKQSLITGRVSDFQVASQTVSAEKGKLVFTQNCALCHSVNQKGGMIGPQLDGVGRWGAQSLAEKILDPNRNISESFRMYSITLKDGKITSGLFRREEGATLVFADAGGKEFSLNKKDILSRKASGLTLMPDQFENTIPQPDFNNLLAYLLTLKN